VTSDVPETPSPRGAAWLLVAVVAIIVGTTYGLRRRASLAVEQEQPSAAATAAIQPSEPPQVAPQPMPPGPPTLVVDRIQRVPIDKVIDEAESLVASLATDAHSGLSVYAAAEDRLRDAVVEAKRAGKKKDDVELTALYRALLVVSDAYTARVVTPELIAATPWRDLLADPTRWSKSNHRSGVLSSPLADELPALSFLLENGVLDCPPPDVGASKEGVIGVLDQGRADLRHFILEMDFQLDGLATLYFHVNPPPNPPIHQMSEAYDLTSVGDGALHKDERYTMRVEYIGSILRISFPGHDIPPYQPNPSWSKRRVGGIAIRIPSGTRLKISRMRIKELR
jgi:hypothetical protein